MKANTSRLIRIGIASFTLAILLTTRPAQALENEVWISPVGPAKTSAGGTPSDPFRCPDGTSLSTVLGLSQFNGSTTFHLMTGTFYTTSNGIPIKAGWKIRGAGIDNTIVTMQTNALPPGIQYNLIQSATFAGTDGAEVSDLTVDCNLQNQSSGNLQMGAVAIYGSNTRISRVKAINWGTTWASHECFVLYLLYSQSTFVGTNYVIEDCIVTKPAPITFACGTTCISVPGNGNISNVVRNAYGVVRNCLVADFSAGSGTGAPQYINAYGAAGIVEHNRALNLIGGTGAYRDATSDWDVVIRNNVFDNVTRGVFYNIYGFNYTGLTIRDNVIRPAEGGSGIILDIFTTNNYATNVVIQGNTVHPCTTATNVTALELAGHVSATVMNNVFQGGGTGYDLFINYPEDPANSGRVQLNTWSGNVNLSGTQLVEGNNNIWQPGDKDMIKFTPSTAGWYRVLQSEGILAADVQLYSDGWNNGKTDVDFWFRVNSYSTTQFGELGLTRQGSYPYPYPGNVPSVRIVSDYPSSVFVYLDIYIPTVTSDVKPLQVTAKGPFRGRLFSAPQLITTTPSVYKQLNF